jgi:hypothetical protein
MALLTVEGVYRDGKVELAETPAGVQEAPVMVVFLPQRSEQGDSSEAAAGATRRMARERLLARMRKGYHLGGGRPYENRADLYDHLERGA